MREGSTCSSPSAVNCQLVIMEYARFTITENDCGRRLDRVLRRLLPAVPLSAIYKMLRKGQIRLDGKKAHPAALCQLSSIIEIDSRAAIIPPKDVNLPNKNIEGDSRSISIEEITVLETPDLLFLNKPQGIAVHGERSLCSTLPKMQAEAASLSFKAGPLHRLDKGTSGIIAFSKTLKGARWFSEAMRERRIVKLYAGILEMRGKALKGGLWLDEGDANGSGKAMETRVIPIASAKGLTLAAFSLHTGRKRQIRRQAAARGMPLLGDARYGASSYGGGYFLHAGLMAFPKERLEGLAPMLEAPPPTRFELAAHDFFGISLADTLRSAYNLL